MNQVEWKRSIKNKSLIKLPHNFWYWRNKAIKYFKKPKNYVIHHLRNTKEQQVFNDQYYERWGFDFDENMKYCVCISEEEHRKIHRLSKETRNKISQGLKKALKNKPKRILSDKQKEKLRLSNLGKKLSIETKLKIAKAHLGRKNSVEHNIHISKARKKSNWAKGKRWWTKNDKSILSAKCPGKGWTLGKNNTYLKGKKRSMSNETKHKMSKSHEGMKYSLETKKKHSKRMKGLLWWNNGIINKRAYLSPGKEWKKGILTHSN